jgi:hypothetical protein
MKDRLLSAAVNLVCNVRILWLLVLVLLYELRITNYELRITNYLSTYQLINLSTYQLINFFTFSALAVSLLIVLFSGTNLERVAFFTDFIAMLLLLELLQRRVGRLWQRRLVVLSCSVVLLLYVPAYLLRQENSDNWHFMEQQMEQPGREVISVRTAIGDNWFIDMLRHRYVNPTAEFGFYCSYMGFDAADVNMRCAALLYGKPRLVFLPEDVVRRMETDSTAYAHYELDASGSLYVWRIASGQHVDSVTFVLNPEAPSSLWPHQRLVAYSGDRYTLDPYRFEEVDVSGRRYVVFTKPTTNIFRRIKRVEVKYY